MLQALEQSPQHSPTCRSAALGSPRHLPAPPRPRCLPLAPGSPSAQHQAALAAGSDTAWHPCASDTDPMDPTGTTTPLRAFPDTHRSIVQPSSPSPSVQPQPGNRSALPLAHSSPSTSNHPFTGRGRHHQPHCPHLGLQPRPTAGAQHKQGAITQRPQRITSSPGLHHSPVQRKSKHSQKGKGDSECLFSHACTKSRERVCSRAQGPQRSPCPWDTSAVVSGAALVSPVGNG